MKNTKEMNIVELTSSTKMGARKGRRAAAAQASTHVTWRTRVLRGVIVGGLRTVEGSIKHNGRVN